MLETESTETVLRIRSVRAFVEVVRVDAPLVIALVADERVRLRPASRRQEKRKHVSAD